MPTLVAEQLPKLAGALLRLRGMTLADVFDATGIRTANLSAWLKGKPQVISATRVTALLYQFGLQGGQLRTDIVHIWADHGEWAQLRTVFGLLSDESAARCLFLDESPGMSKTAFLRWGDAWVRITTTPSATGKENLTAVVKPDQAVVLPVPLEGIPTNSVEATRSTLLSLAEEGGLEIPTGELVPGFIKALQDAGDHPFVRTGLDGIGWTFLEASLRKALREGVSPAELAVRIEKLLW